MRPAIPLGAFNAGISHSLQQAQLSQAKDTLKAAQAGQASGENGEVTNAQQAELEKAAHAFEGMLWQMMLKSMRQTIGKSDFLHGGMGEDFFQDLKLQHEAESFAKQSSLGLADQIIRQLSTDSRKGYNPYPFKMGAQAYENAQALSASQKEDRHDTAN